MINIGLVTLSINSGSKLLWGSEYPDNQVCLRDLAEMGKFVIVLS